MGLFSIFSKKKEEKKPKAEVNVRPTVSEEYSVPIIGADDKDFLLKNADTGRPAYISGGDFTGKTIILVSKPSDVRQIVFNGRAYDVVTIDRVMVGQFKDVTFPSTATPEEVNRCIALSKKLSAEAKVEKAQFDKHQYEPGYEAHRYMKAAPKPAPKPQQQNPVKQPVPKVQTAQPAQQLKPVPKPTPKPALQPKPQPTQENQPSVKAPAKVVTESKPKERPVTAPQFDKERPEDKTIVFYLDKFISALPEFDFYNGDNDKKVSEDDENVKLINQMREDAEQQFRAAYRAEQASDWRYAARTYEAFVSERYWDPKPFLRLIKMYQNSHVSSEIIQELKKLTIDFFTQRREKMKANVLRLADKYDARIYAEKCISEGKVITYYDGLFELYNPYKEIDELK